MAANNDLGSLSYSLNIDISQIPDTIRDVEKQLSTINTVADVAMRTDPNQLINSIKQALMAEDFKLKVSLDESFKDVIGKATSVIKQAVTGGEDEKAQIGYIDSLILKLKDLEVQYKNLPKSADASAIISEFKSVQTELDKTGRNLSAAFNKSWSDISAMAESTTGDIKSKIKSLEQYKLNIPVSNLSDIRAVNALILKLKNDIKSLQSPVSVKNFGEVMGMDANTLNQITDKLKEIRKLRGEINVNSPAGISQINSLNKSEADLLRLQQQRLGVNRQINESYRSQSQIVEGLTTKMLAYFSIQKMQQFTTKLIETRGEFEKQQIALQSILQSKEQADRLFAQVVDLGLKSPFSIMQLNSYVKQLSAYRIETDQLYDTTKRLADISAGLGVDMQRLILAYGQVRAASVLRGQEVRQFTEAGIPLIEALADQFTKLEGKAVSTSEVFDKISNRLVPFEMVRDVLFEMTDAGGMFFNLQEKLADSVAAKWKNLQDAIDVMFNSIGQENEGFLKGMAEGLTAMTENWRQLLDLITATGAALVVMKSLSVGRNVLNIGAAMNQGFSFKEANQYVTKLATNTELIALRTQNVGRHWAGVGKVFKEFSGSVWTFAKANWPMLLVGAIAAIAANIYSSYKEASRFKNELMSIANEGVKEANTLVEAHDALVKKLGELVEGTVAYKETRDKLISQFGEYYDTIQLEAEGYDYIRRNADAATSAIREKMRLSAMEKAQAKIDEKFGNKQTNIESSIIGYSTSVESGGINKNAAVAKSDIIEIIKRTRQFIRDTNGEVVDINNAVRNIIKQYGLTDIQASYISSNSDWHKLVDVIKDADETATDFSETLNMLSESSHNLTKQQLEDFRAREKAIKDELIAEENRIKNTEKNENLSGEKVNAARVKAYEDLKALSKEYSNYRLSEYNSELKRIEVTSGKIREAVKKTLGYESEFFSSFSGFKDAKSMQDAFKDMKAIVADPTKSDNDLKATQNRMKALQKVAAELGVDLDPKASKKSSKQAEDARLAQYKAEIALVKQAYSDYKKYLEVLDDVNAKKKLTDKYQLQFEQLFKNETDAIKYATDATSYYNKVQKDMAKFSSPKDLALKNNVAKEIAGTETDDELDRLKKDWKDLNDLFDLKKEAYALRDMYMQKGISQSIAESFVKQIYGDIPLEFDSFREDVSAKLSDVAGNWGSDSGKAFKNKFGQEARTSFLDMLEKFQTTQQKIDGINYKYTQIYKELATQRTAANASENDEMVANAEKAKAEELAAVTATAIQMTEAYQKMFGNISDLSEKELRYIIDKWKNALNSASRNLDGTFSITLDGKQFKTTEQQIASFTKKVLASEKELRSKNPFKALQDSLKELQANTNALNDNRIMQDFWEGTKEGATPKELERINAEIEKLREEEKALDLKNATTWAKMSGLINNVTKQITDLSESVISLFEAFGASDDTADTLNDLVSIVSGLGDTASGISRIASGDVIGGLTQGIKGIAGVVSSIFSIGDRKHEKQIRKLQKAIDASRIAYEQLGRAAAKALGNAEYDTNKLQIAELKRQQQLIQGQIRAENAKKKTDKDKIKGWEEEYRQLGYEIEDIITDITESLTGNLKDMASEMTNALVGAFEAGDDAQKAMFESIKSNLKQTISAQFQKSVVDGLIKPLFDNMDSMLGITANTKEITNQQDKIADLKKQLDETNIFDVAKKTALSEAIRQAEAELNSLQSKDGNYKFTPEQVKELISQAEGISEDVMDIFNSGGWKEIFDALSASEQLSGLSKGIQGLTEDTAQILEAYLNTIRDVVISIMIINENQLSLLQASQLLQSQILTEVATISSAVVAINNALHSVIAQSNGDNGAGIRVYVK